MPSEINSARWQNAATGGGSGVVRVGNGYEDAGLGGNGARTEGLPDRSGLQWIQGGGMMKGTPWGLREGTPQDVEAGRLALELEQSAATSFPEGVTAEDAAKCAERLRAGIRNCEYNDSSWPRLEGEIRARFALPGSYVVDTSGQSSFQNADGATRGGSGLTAVKPSLALPLIKDTVEEFYRLNKEHMTLRDKCVRVLFTDSSQQYAEDQRAKKALKEYGAIGQTLVLKAEEYQTAIGALGALDPAGLEALRLKYR